MYLTFSNANDRDITNEKNRVSKTKVTIRDDPSNKPKDSVHADEVVHNKPGDSVIVSDQGLNKHTHNSSNNLVFFGDSNLKGINIKNLKSKLYNTNCSCIIQTFRPLYSRNFKRNRYDNRYCCFTYGD